MKTHHRPSGQELLSLRVVADIGAILARRGSLRLSYSTDNPAAGQLSPGPILMATGEQRYQLTVAIHVVGQNVDYLTCGEFVGAQYRDHAGPISLNEGQLSDVLFAAELLMLAVREILFYLRERGFSDNGRLAGARAAIAGARAAIAGEHTAIAGERAAIAGARAARQQYADIIGASASMQALYAILDRVVKSESTVLIQGENGTGKELVARAIHQHSPRSSERFVVTNCSAFQDNLLDSELFGHVKGAFTGAVADKPGLFESANNGTFFLDEIGDMSPALQVKVLRVLQEGTFTPVGSTETRHVDVRIIAATNRNLDRMVQESRFREDLYYRVNVINLDIPPLRERDGDIELLIARFLQRHAGVGVSPKELSSTCRRILLEHHWPGNVRELENEIERLVVFAGDSARIDETMLSRRVRDGLAIDSGPVPVGGLSAPVLHTASPAAVRTQPSVAAATESLPDALRALERMMILNALRHHNWNKTRAAVALSISRRNLIRLVQKYDLEAERSG